MVSAIRNKVIIEYDQVPSPLLFQGYQPYFFSRSKGCPITSYMLNTKTSNSKPGREIGFAFIDSANNIYFRFEAFKELP